MAGTAEASVSGTAETESSRSGVGRYKDTWSVLCGHQWCFQGDGKTEPPQQSRFSATARSDVPNESKADLPQRKSSSGDMWERLGTKGHVGHNSLQICEHVHTQATGGRENTGCTDLAMSPQPRNTGKGTCPPAPRVLLSTPATFRHTYNFSKFYPQKLKYK